MKHFLGKASEWGWIGDAHAAKLRMVALLKEPPGRVRYLSDAEREKLYAVLTPDFRRVVLAGVLSGMRRAEVVKLRKDQVDLKRRMITLTKTKGNKVRHVPINDALALVLDDAMAQSTVRRAGAGLDVVAKLLGHATLAMSQRYAHLGDDQLHETVKGLGAGGIAPAMPPAGSKTAGKPAKTA